MDIWVGVGVLLSLFTFTHDAEEDRLYEVALTGINVANDPHLLPYPF